MIKEELQQYRGLQREKEKLELKIEVLEEEFYSPKEQVISDMPKGSNDGNSEELRRVKLIDSLSELRRYYEDLIIRISEEQIRIEKAIEPLKPTERTVMRLRYIDGRRWEDICVLMNYSWNNVHRIHRLALKHIKEN